MEILKENIDELLMKTKYITKNQYKDIKLNIIGVQNTKTDIQHYMAKMWVLNNNNIKLLKK